jgi:hypothetical protein
MEKKIVEIYNYFLEETKDKEVGLELLKEWAIFEREKGRQAQSKTTISQNKPQGITDAQKWKLDSLGYKKETKDLTKQQAFDLIKDLIAEQENF